MPDIDAARRETLRYHSAVFGGRHPAAWTDRPQRLVADVVERFAAAGDPVHAYDLGAGSGRHSVLMARRLPPGSRVTAVDLLPVALERLRENADAAGVGHLVEPVRADAERYRFAADDAGLVLAVSVVEHLPSPAAVQALLRRCRQATRPGGVHVVVVHADRYELAPRTARRAPVECRLRAADARDLLRRAYRGWQVTLTRSTPATTREVRGGEAYALRSTTVALVARAPGG